TNYYDIINAAGGNNLVLGDNGMAQFAQALGDGGNAITAYVAVNPMLPKGGGGAVQAVSLSGAVDLNSGVPVSASSTAVYGYAYTTDGDPSDIDWIESVAWSTGGADNVTTLGGVDIVLGGAGADTIGAGDGYNLVVGDSAQIAAALMDATDATGRFAEGA